MGSHHVNHSSCASCIRKVYVAPEDTNWFSKNMEEFLDLLESAEWNNNFILLLNEIAQTETEE